jgi:hypothetical protein
MKQFTISADQFIDRPIAAVFDRVCGQYFIYQPVWDPAIVEITPVSTAPVWVRDKAQITRKFRGKLQQGESEIVEMVTGSSILVENRYPNNRERRRISCHVLRGGGTRLHIEINSEIGFVAGLIAPLTTALVERALVLSLRSVKLAIEDESPKTEPS